MAPLTKLVELEHDQQLAELVESWDFSRGKSFQNMVLADLGAPVHHPSSSPAGSFSLLAVFRRYTFRLAEDSVMLDQLDRLERRSMGKLTFCWGKS